jgi:energy-coupling factor transport system ATP-binding protein
LTPTANGAASLAAHHLSITHRGGDRPAIDDLSFELAPGRTMLVVGPSGSGKSTLALAIAGLIPREIPSTVDGRLELDGHDLRETDGRAVAARVGLVFQDPASQLVMDRVDDDVAFGLENRAWPRASMGAAVDSSLAAVGLAGLTRRRSRTLSGGQQQRLALAGVLAADPGLLVLDEPTANLDPDGTDALIRWLRRVRDARRTTIVLVEHRVEVAWPLASLVVALDRDGSTIDVGPPDVVAARSGERMRAAGIWLPEAVETALGPVEPGMSRLAAQRGSPGDVVVSAAGVTFGFDRRIPVLHDVSVDAAAGERVALVGRNGSGKSTLGQLLVGLRRADVGEVRLLGDDPSRLSAADLARRAAYVFQEPERQFLAQRVEDEVALGLRPDEEGRVAPLMDRLGLPLGTFGARSPYRLSGGEQRRLSLACALVREPRLLVLDEPTFGQDRIGYAGLLEIIGERLDAGATLIAATHDERFVRDVADRVIELDDGRIVRHSVAP